MGKSREIRPPDRPPPDVPRRPPAPPPSRKRTFRQGRHRRTEQYALKLLLFQTITPPSIAVHLGLGALEPCGALQRRHHEPVSRALNAGAGVQVRGGVACGPASDAAEVKNRTVQSRRCRTQ